ncbi:MAG: nodulation protein NfeD [Syntrophomonadaceae bacterium]|nr:nodulation protein NfeD [Syntrophomonadaceae bacterium]
MRRFFLTLFCSVFILLNFPAVSTAVGEKSSVYTVKVEDTVTAGTAKYIGRGIKLAEKEKAGAVVILINTPGGLVTATLDIIQDISNSAVPVVTYVTPKGAIAASAGTFILLDGHIAAMSPGTTCGAAMPVNISIPGDTPKPADQKTVNFLAGHMKSIAEERGRPADLAEAFVRENLTLNYSEALDRGVVDVTAADLDELLEKVHGMKVKTKAGTSELNTREAEVKHLEMSTDEKLIDVVSNPTMAMVFLMLGIYGLIIGFHSPGFFLPEVLGSISLILGLYGLGLFEINLAAGLLILLGIGLLIAEAFTPTYGILGVGGVVSLVLGVLFFPVEPLMPRDWFAAFRFMALGVGLVGAVFLFVVLAGIFRLRRLKVTHSDSEFFSKEGRVVKDLNPDGQVKIQGEIWKASARGGQVIPAGELVKVVERQGMLLIVEPLAKAVKEGD